MRPTRFIHAAGFRLDSPYSGLREPSAVVDERLRAAPFEAFRNLQALCESEVPDFLLIAGGVFDLADRSVHAQLAFRDGLAAIAGKGVPVYLVHGPEDPAAAWLPTIDWADGVHVLGGRPEWTTVAKDDETIALLQGASQQSSALPGPSASDFLPPPGGDVFSIGLVNNVVSTDEDQASSQNSLPGLHYWALGPEREGAIANDPSRRILTTGPAQALSPTETGPHGCYVIETDEAGRAGPTFVALDSVRWEKVAVDISVLTPEELIPAARQAVIDALVNADGRDLVCHLTLTGNARSQVASAESLLSDLRESVLFERPWAWIDRVENLTDVAAQPPTTGPASTPLLDALHDRYESLIHDDTLEELVGAAATDLASAEDDDRLERVARIARDAHNLAVQRLSPTGNDPS